MALTGALGLTIGLAFAGRVMVLRTVTALLTGELSTASVTIGAIETLCTVQAVWERKVGPRTLITVRTVVTWKALRTRRPGETCVAAELTVVTGELGQACVAAWRGEVRVVTAADALVASAKRTLAIKRAFISKVALVDDIGIIVVAVR